MEVLELLFLSVGLSMDAFAMSVCKGLAVSRLTAKDIVTVGLWFGLFQAFMPVAGCMLGSAFNKYILSLEHWISFGLLCSIGVNMLRESLSSDEESTNSSLSFSVMLMLSVASSIDALAAGFTFAFLNVDLPVAVVIIGMTTFFLSAVGVKTGNAFGRKYKSKAEASGGIILILLGIKILMEHLGIFNV